MNITELNLSVRAENLLRANGITTTEDLSRYTIAEIRRWRNCGRRTQCELLRLREEGIVKFAEDITQNTTEPTPEQRSLPCLSEIHQAIDKIISEKESSIKESHSEIVRLLRDNQKKDLEIKKAKARISLLEDHIGNLQERIDELVVKKEFEYYCSEQEILNNSIVLDPLWKENAKKPIPSIGAIFRANADLESYGITRLGDIANMSRKEMRLLFNSFRDIVSIEDILSENGLMLGMSIDMDGGTPVLMDNTLKP